MFCCFVSFCWDGIIVVGVCSLVFGLDGGAVGPWWATLCEMWYLAFNSIVYNYLVQSSLSPSSSSIYYISVPHIIPYPISTPAPLSSPL